MPGEDNVSEGGHTPGHKGFSRVDEGGNEGGSSCSPKAGMFERPAEVRSGARVCRAVPSAVKNKICVNPHERNVFMGSGCVLPRAGYLIGSFAGVPAFLGYLAGVAATFSIFTSDLW